MLRAPAVACLPARCSSEAVPPTTEAPCPTVTLAARFARPPMSSVMLLARCSSTTEFAACVVGSRATVYIAVELLV